MSSFFEKFKFSKKNKKITTNSNPSPPDDAVTQDTLTQNTTQDVLNTSEFLGQEELPIKDIQNLVKTQDELLNTQGILEFKNIVTNSDQFKELKEIINGLKINFGTEHITSNLEKIIAGTAPKVAIKTEIIPQIDNLISDYQNTIKQKDLTLASIEKLKNLLLTENQQKVIDFENFQGNCKFIKDYFDVLFEIKKNAPEIFEKYNFEDIYNQTYVLAQKYDSQLALVLTLVESQKALTNEINKYSQAVKDLESKFKLSPTWEGKKPKMIELGKLLNEKRELSVKEETQLNAVLKELYIEFLNGEKHLKAMLKDLIEDIKIQALNFKDINNSIQSLILLKERLDNYIKTNI